MSVGFLATTPRRTWGRIFGTRKVIVDSSTLIHLSAIGRFALLKDLYGQLTVTPAVWREVVEQGKDRTRHELGEGEAEVIALAIEHQVVSRSWTSPTQGELRRPLGLRKRAPSESSSEQTWKGRLTRCAPSWTRSARKLASGSRTIFIQGDRGSRGVVHVGIRFPIEEG